MGSQAGARYVAGGVCARRGVRSAPRARRSASPCGPRSGRVAEVWAEVFVDLGLASADILRRFAEARLPGTSRVNRPGSRGDSGDWHSTSIPDTHTVHLTLAARSGFDTSTHDLTHIEEQPTDSAATGPLAHLASKGLAGPTGFEPAISSVTGWHVWPLHHGPAESDGGGA